jgi:hypothetical protein
VMVHCVFQSANRVDRPVGKFKFETLVFVLDLATFAQAGFCGGEVLLVGPDPNSEQTKDASSSTLLPLFNPG